MTYHPPYVNTAGRTGMITGAAGWMVGQIVNSADPAGAANPISVGNAASYGGVLLAGIGFLTLVVNRFFDDRKQARDQKMADMERRITKNSRRLKSQARTLSQREAEIRERDDAMKGLRKTIGDLAEASLILKGDVKPREARE